MTIEPNEPTSNHQLKPESLSGRRLLRFTGLSTQLRESPESILTRVALSLTGLQAKAVIAVRLHDADGVQKRLVYALQVTPAGTAFRPELRLAPTLTVLCRLDTFHALIAGTVSPVEAYLDGRLHLQGDVALAKRIALQLPHDGEIVNVCPMLDGEQWVSEHNGYGALTLSGFNFTPFGQADVIYDWGGGQYRESPFADAQGRFRVVQDNIPCGPIPGRPDGAGVVVSAFDLTTGQALITGPVPYSTPC